MTRPKTERAQADGLYSGQFSSKELALLAACISHPTLDDEIWLQRVLNQRLMVHATAAPGELPIDTGTLIKIAAALAIGTGRVARLLRDQAALGAGTVDSLQETIDRALDEIGIERGVPL